MCQAGHLYLSGWSFHKHKDTNTTCMVLVVLELSSHLKTQRYRHKQSFESYVGQFDIRHKLQKTFDHAVLTQDGKIGARCSDSGARETQDGCGYGDKEMQNASERHSYIAPTTFFQFNMFERRNLPKWKLSV